MVKWLVGIILLDQASKFLAPRLGFEVVFNRGVAFGLFPGFIWLIVLPLVLWLIVLLKKHPSFRHSLLETKYLILILAGGLSNLIDRFFFGVVRDWISLPLIPTFNLADLAISLGFLLLACELFGFGNAVFRNVRRPKE